MLYLWLYNQVIVFQGKPILSILCYWYIRFDHIRWKPGVINNKNSTTKYSQQNKPHFSACRLSHVSMLPQTDLISETDRLSANLKNKRVWWDGWWKSTINVPKVILLVYIKSRNPQKNPEDPTSQAPSPINQKPQPNKPNSRSQPLNPNPKTTINEKRWG